METEEHQAIWERAPPATGEDFQQKKEKEHPLALSKLFLAKCKQSKEKY